MATVLESLRGVNAYPVPLRTITEIAERRGVTLEATATREILKGREYNLAVADILMWLSMAPNVTQGGQSYSFTDDQRQQFRNRAEALLDEFKDETPRGVVYGYKGSRL